MAVTVDGFNGLIKAVKLSTDSIRPDNTFTEYFDTVECIVKNHENAKTSELQSILKKLHSERESLCQLKDQLAFFKQKYSETSKQIEAVQPPSEKDLCSRKLSKLFTDAAGLEFKVNHTGSTISMIFNKLDPNDSNREFIITLDVQDHTNKWILIDVTPDIEGLLLLVQQLNTDNNLHQFGRKVRGLFKRSLQINH